MTTIINTNIASQIAQNYLQNNQAAVTSAITQLSSGLAINSAADNPAGLAISTTLQAQINGQTVAQQNANNGISLAQTGQSALTQITNNLQTIRQLAVQASNASNSASNRASLNQEVQQALAQINTISSTTSFNGQNLLDGSFGTQNFQVGANAGQTIGVNLSASMKTGSIGQTYSSTLSLAGTSGLASQPLSVSVGGAASVTIANAVAGTGAGQSADSAYAAAQAINNANISGLSATANNSQQFSLSTVNNTGTSAENYNLTINNVNIFGATGQSVAANGSISTTSIVNAINQYSSQSGVTATLNNDGSVNLTAADGSDITVSQSGGANVSGGLDNTGYTVGNGTYGGLSATSYGGGTSTSGELQGTVQLQSASSITLSGGAAAAIQAQNAANTGSQLSAAAQTLTGGTFATPGLALTGGAFSINGINVTATSSSNLTASQIATAINSNSSLAALGITASTATNGANTSLVLSSTSTPISVSGTKANTILGQTAATTSLTNAALNDAAVVTDISSGNLTAGQLTINGVNVTGSNITTAAGLASAINNNTQLQALGIKATGSNAAGVSISTSSPIALNIGGSLGSTIVPSGTAQTITGGATADSALANTAGTFTNALTLTAGQFTINGTSITGSFTTLASLNTAIQAVNPNLTATIAGGASGSLTLTSSNSTGFTVGGSQASALLGETLATQSASSYSVNQTGSLANIDVLTVADAQKTIQAVDSALGQVNTLQGQLGAVQNRFTSIISNLSSSVQNAQSAQSSIQDTNYASETSALSRAQVLSQAAQAMVAQANQLPQQVLKLLQ